ncbi:MAG TPA: hypothetical protein VF696_01800 [Candidatus Paceibacterota bacterium]|jgi:hypothetical protein
MATKKTDTKKALAAGGILAAAAAAAAGYYFYGDKNAKKHRQAASTWAKSMKSDVVKEAKALKKLDQKAIARVVDRAAAVYEGVRSVDRKDLRTAAGELKRHWQQIEREIKGAAGNTSVRATKKAVSKKAPTKRKTASKKAKN